MAAYLETRTSRAALWSRRIALFSFVLFVISGLGHRQGLVETNGFLWILALVAALALGALILVAASFRGIWSRGDGGGRSAALAFVVALAVLTPYGVLAAKSLVYPRLNDISTDLVDPPSLSSASSSSDGPDEPCQPDFPQGG